MEVTLTLRQIGYILVGSVIVGAFAHPRISQYYERKGAEMVINMEIGHIKSSLDKLEKEVEASRWERQKMREVLTAISTKLEIDHPNLSSASAPIGAIPFIMRTNDQIVQDLSDVTLFDRAG